MVRVCDVASLAERITGARSAMSSRSVRKAATLERPLLIVRGTLDDVPFDYEPKGMGYSEFDSPAALALASEGFCPYHRGPGQEPVRVLRRPDGLVWCPKDRVVMRWEWTEDRGIGTGLP